ncbi:hypothetical protein ACJIZ3_019370 [Penstemon smallii]|uniref:Uncharacterized protein n=1 Tax=Penstemon smallii TaxID=265156 RepID=A0ABD3T2F3_9LAMI
MGACLSSKSTDNTKPCAYVVSSDGQLRQYPIPITVSQVLQFETSSPDSFFLCNSDRLYFDDFIPSLKPDEQLQSAQIYFVLSTAKLQYRLAASDMAALAVKASVALEQINRRGGRNRKARISPVLVAEEDPQSNFQVNQNKSSNGNGNGNSKSSSVGLGVSRSGSVRKLSRYSSRRAKLAVRSFRMKLNTIYEGSVLLLA